MPAATCTLALTSIDLEHPLKQARQITWSSEMVRA